ncbi:MAG: dimethylarginine dimethylaminohydrolase family protein [Candidatus Acidiferrales bacterium]
MTDKRYGGHSMVAPLRRVMICPTRCAGWANPDRAGRWRELCFLHEPDVRAAQAQHDAMRAELESAGAEVVSLPEANGFSLDAVYCHDASFPTDHGIVALRMGKPARSAEPARHAEFLAARGVPLLGKIQEPGTVEGGDLVWLDESTILAGRGYRTNTAGLDQLRGLLAIHGIDVIAAPLLHGPGPAGCLHLMSLISMLDDRVALVDLEMLAVETVELLCGRSFQFIEIDPNERATLACNVLALGNRRLLALEENRRTNQRLRDAGFDVRTFPGSEISINGGGGPTCLTRPLLRLEDVSRS